MNKNEKIIIKPLMNGYLVEYSYRSVKPVDELGWNYVEEESMFGTWDEVVQFVQNTPLEVPPAKI